jgi:long-chain acyl-CoA synthetase
LISGEIKRLSTDLSNYECIQKFVVLDCEFTQENGDLTPTLKVIRNAVEKKYARGIEMMYSSTT